MSFFSFRFQFVPAAAFCPWCPLGIDSHSAVPFFEHLPKSHNIINANQGNSRTNYYLLEHTHVPRRPSFLFESNLSQRQRVPGVHSVSMDGQPAPRPFV